MFLKLFSKQINQFEKYKKTVHLLIKEWNV